MAAAKEKPTYGYMRPSTRNKYARIATNDKRELIETYDIVADEALKSRGLDRPRRRRVSASNPS